MMLFDAHCHLQDKAFAGSLPLVIDRARAAGVARMLCCGCEERDWEKVRDLAREYKGVLPSFGLHPWYVGARSETWLVTLKSFLLYAPSGVGETGLDHGIEPRNDAEQEAVFVAQLRLARELRRPITIHCRKAWGRLMEILNQEDGVKFGGIIHSYSGSPELVRPLEEMGLHISFSGAITRSGNKRGRESLMLVSREKLLLETDSPDLTPVGAAGKVNEPANLALVASATAALRGEPVAVVAELTGNNANCLFSSIPI